LTINLSFSYVHFLVHEPDSNQPEDLKYLFSPLSLLGALAVLAMAVGCATTELGPLLALKRILIPIFFALAFWSTSTKAEDEGYLGTVLENGAATYVVRMDDGRLLDVEWDSGYDDWSRGDRVILTTESGGGYMYSDSGQTEVDVFPYNPADFGD
jgi:hypothetical protein